MCAQIKRLMRSVPREEKQLQPFPVEVEQRERSSRLPFLSKRLPAGSAHVRTGLYISTRVTFAHYQGGKGAMKEELRGIGGQQENTEICCLFF